MFYFLYSFWSDDQSPQALRAALADSAECAGSCTDAAAPQARHFTLWNHETIEITCTFLVTLQSSSLLNDFAH